MSITQTIQKIRQHLPAHVTLIAVSKTQKPEALKEAYEAGQRDFGENYVQELREKFSVLPEDVRWHFIGHLQRNKVKYIIDRAATIQSVDSLPLAEEIDKRACQIGKVQTILIEVKSDESPQKTGLSAQQVPHLISAISKLPYVRLIGLMTIPPLSRDPEATRPYFQKLKKLRDDINAQKLYKDPLTELSMGMSNDYKVALEEGATMIRIGTALFGQRQP